MALASKNGLAERACPRIVQIGNFPTGVEVEVERVGSRLGIVNIAYFEGNKSRRQEHSTR